MAFCCISIGEFHFQNCEAAEITVSVVWKALSKSKSGRQFIYCLPSFLFCTAGGFPGSTKKTILFHRNGFGQVSGLVDIAASVKRDVIGKELEGQHRKAGQKNIVGIGDGYYFVRCLLNLFL